MDVTLTIPEDLAERLGAANLPRRALEALAAEAFRAGRLTQPELCRLLGLGTSAQLAAFLKAHGIEGPAVPPKQDRDRQGQAETLLARFRAFRVGKRLSGLDPVALIREGRR